MNKANAIELCGGSISSAAKELGITSSAISQWPETGELPEGVQNRVLAYLARKHLPPELIGREGAPNPASGPAQGEPAAAQT
jgi:hypothetical protein